MISKDLAKFVLQGHQKRHMHGFGDGCNTDFWVTCVSFGYGCLTTFGDHLPYDGSWFSHVSSPS